MPSSSLTPFSRLSRLSSLSPHPPPFKPKPRPKVLLNLLPHDILLRLAEYVTANDSSRQTLDALHLAETSPLLRHIILEHLSHKLYMYYSIDFPARWTTIFLGNVRTLIFGDDYPGFFHQDLNPHPLQLLEANTLKRVEVNREDVQVMERVLKSPTVTELVVRFHKGMSHTSLLRGMADMNLTLVEFQCFCRHLDDCPFKEGAKWCIRESAVDRRCPHLKQFRRSCVREKHPFYDLI